MDKEQVPTIEEINRVTSWILEQRKQLAKGIISQCPLCNSPSQLTYSHYEKNQKNLKKEAVLCSACHGVGKISSEINRWEETMILCEKCHGIGAVLE